MICALDLAMVAGAVHGVRLAPARASDMAIIRGALCSQRMNPVNLECANFVTARGKSEQLVGAAQLRPLGGPDAPHELASLFVLPEYRWLGIGSALVRECLGRARGLGVDVLLLTLTTRAGFYERLGFTAVDSISALPPTLKVELALGQVVSRAFGNPAGIVAMSQKVRPTRSARQPRATLRMAGGPGPDRPFNENPALVQSQKNGAVLFVLVLIFNLWFFTVPPEIRRTHVCASDQFETAARYHIDCVSEDAWRQLVKDHYATCKGLNECVHFDFSIDPKTLAQNKAMFNEVMQK